MTFVMLEALVKINKTFHNIKYLAYTAHTNSIKQKKKIICHLVDLPQFSYNVSFLFLK